MFRVPLSASFHASAGKPRRVNRPAFPAARFFDSHAAAARAANSARWLNLALAGGAPDGLERTALAGAAAPS